MRRPLASRHRLVRRIAAAGGLAAEAAEIRFAQWRAHTADAIETLAENLRQACARGKTMRANVGGASVSLTAKGALSVSLEAPRRKRGP